MVNIVIDMIENSPTVVIVNPELAASVTDVAVIDGDSVVRDDGTLVIFSPSAEAVVDASPEDVVRIEM